MIKEKSKQELVSDNWMLTYEFENGIQIWCHEPRFEEVVQYMYWNPKTEESMGIETIPYENLKMMNSIYQCLSNNK